MIMCRTSPLGCEPNSSAFFLGAGVPEALAAAAAEAPGDGGGDAQGGAQPNAGAGAPGRICRLGGEEGAAAAQRLSCRSRCGGGEGRRRWRRVAGRRGPRRRRRARGCGRRGIRVRSGCWRARRPWSILWVWRRRWLPRRGGVGRGASPEILFFAPLTLLARQPLLQPSVAPNSSEIAVGKKIWDISPQLAACNVHPVPALTSARNRLRTAFPKSKHRTTRPRASSSGRSASRLRCTPSWKPRRGKEERESF